MFTESLISVNPAKVQSREAGGGNPQTGSRSTTWREGRVVQGMMGSVVWCVSVHVFRVRVFVW